MTHFLAVYGTEKQCEVTLLRERWPQDIQYPACGSDAFQYTFKRRNLRY
ncbi:transposase [Janthinobacterium sp. NKUCC06_STL]|nr:transposase [Janthinobacterium sp. NKUCC06_STL]MBW3512040.1 hypothetical protein [Janthinobacterium sp. NKUCC06_STL]